MKFFRLIGTAALACVVIGILGSCVIAQAPGAIGPLRIKKSDSIDMGMRIVPAGSLYGIGIYQDPGSKAPVDSFDQTAPLAIEVVDDRGTSTWLTGGYDAFTQTKDGFHCTGALKTQNGTVFRVMDDYSALPSGISLTRKVSVETPSPSDKGFNSQFSLRPTAPTAMKDDDFLVPGNWYKQNERVPRTALASSLEDQAYYIREDRMPLPMVMVRDRRSGTTLTLAHLDADGSTIPDEDGLSRITDARLQFGSLGVLNTSSPSPVFMFPGMEGERTYISGASPDRGRWTPRCHPVEVGVPHTYRLLIRLSETPSYAAAVAEAWRAVYNLNKPPVIRADMAKVYKAGMDLLDGYIHPYVGVIGVPFAGKTPGGEGVDASSDMGFAGQALPCAALLLRYGLDTNDAGAVDRAGQVVDFWARNSMSPAGVPRTRYDVHHGGAFTWRDDHTFLRTACDGSDGALRAWNVMRKRGRDRPEWLAFCRQVGDWLVKIQNGDGSWAREYDLEGNAVNAAADTTDRPIVFLVDLFMATGDIRYRDAALKAGEFCLRSVHDGYAYVGGMPDDPSVMDREGGVMAMAAFLALYDLGRQDRWLAAATQAGWYSETWIYCWNVPMPKDDPEVIFPRNRKTYGLSLIAAGHSDSDNDMAGATFLYYRLFLLTGEKHFLDLSSMLLYDTRQMTDGDGALGYACSGFLTEALSLAPARGHGAANWRPRLTASILDPLTRLQDVFGGMDINQIGTLPRVERLARDAVFATDHGFGS